jgi:hypothetical protein
MDLSDDEIRQFGSLYFKNSETLASAIGHGTVLNWDQIPFEVQKRIIQSADLIDPIQVDRRNK